MPLVKLTAKPDTWFKEGTEVLYQDSDWVERRMTLAEYEDLTTSQWPHAVFVGEVEGGKDGELCQLEEFNVGIIPDTSNYE